MYPQAGHRASQRLVQETRPAVQLSSHPKPCRQMLRRKFYASVQRGRGVSFKVPIAGGNEPSQGQGGDLILSSLSCFPLPFINEVPSGVWLVAQYPDLTTRWHNCSSHASKGRPGVRITGKIDSHPGLEGILRNHLGHLYVFRKMEVLFIFKDSQLLLSFLQDPLKGFAARGQRQDSVLDTWKPGIQTSLASKTHTLGF